mgnify:CR=1 FL=1
MWGMYWRYLVSNSFLLLLVAWLFEQLNLLRFVEDSHLIPTVFWGGIGAIWVLITLMQKNGLPYLFFGRRLGLNTDKWQQFNLLLIVLFAMLSVLGYVINQFGSATVWSLYKLYGQTVCLIIFPLLAARFANKITKPIFKNKKLPSL